MPGPIHARDCRVTTSADGTTLGDGDCRVTLFWREAVQDVVNMIGGIGRSQLRAVAHSSRGRKLRPLKSRWIGLPVKQPD